ncbi:MAG: histidine kinase [Cyclobacteriaceae bacterium]|nr:histidine kinase [Cyclobacteriaceae bacterium HetDA_MAG_MS6]
MALKEKYVRWVGIPILALIMMFVNKHHSGEPYLFSYFVSFTFTFIYWNGAFLIFMMYRKFFPEISQTPKRLSLTVATLILYIFLVAPFIRIAFGYVTWEQIMELEVLLQNKFSAIVAAIIVGSIYENAFFFEKWKLSIRQNEELKNRQIRTQFEVLQNQMSPHFLFNSLNALTTLIAEDQDIAIEFTQKLSDVYRYILQNKEKELVHLKEELEFSEAYLYLLKMRYPENLEVQYEIPEKRKEDHIAPLTIQMLIENAIKHNVVSKAHPLQIHISVKNDEIVVRNNLQKKNAIEKSTKTGLNNIQKRYEILGDKQINIAVSETSFEVRIPLMHVIDERDYHLAIQA